MMSAAHYYPKLMSVMGNVLRFLPAFVRMKQLIEEGYVGELLVCEVQVHSGSLLGKKYNWSCDDLMGGGGLHSVGTYIIDLLMSNLLDSLSCFGTSHSWNHTG